MWTISGIAVFIMFAASLYASKKYCSHDWLYFKPVLLEKGYSGDRQRFVEQLRTCSRCGKVKIKRSGEHDCFEMRCGHLNQYMKNMMDNESKIATLEKELGIR